MRRLILTAFTGADNSSLDIGRILWLAVTISYIGLECAAVYRGVVFDPMSFSGGVAGITVAFSSALKIKQTTEPEKQ